MDEETGVVLVDGDSVPYRATFLIDEEGMVFMKGSTTCLSDETF